MITTTSPSRIRTTHDWTAAWRHVDLSLIVLTLVTSTFGAVLVFSATRHKASPYAYIEKDVVFIIIGVAVMAVCAAVDYHHLADLARAVYGLTLVALAAVLAVGSVHQNIRAWFDVGPIEIQPAEFAKLAVIVVLAAYLGGLADQLSLRHVVVALVILGVPMGLILLQPDLGTMLVFLVIGVGMLVAAGTPARYLIALLIVGLGGIFFVLNSNTLDQYQKERLTSFVAPSQASAKVIYNTQRAQEAIASGGTTGAGLFDGPQTKGGFVPVQESDFIFTVPAEELGFAGAGALLALLGLIVWRVWRAAQLAQDAVGRLICVGVLCMLVFHIFENVGMNLGIMPITGIPLPFVSYGGSATLTAFAGIGLVLNVNMRRYS
jgi:rod shape determining protein RodA